MDLYRVAETAAPDTSKPVVILGRWLVAMSKNSKKRSSSAVQQPSVKVQLLAVHHELTVPVGSAWSIRQVFAHIEQEARRQYPTEQYVTGGVKFPDGRFERMRKSASKRTCFCSTARQILSSAKRKQPATAYGPAQATAHR